MMRPQLITRGNKRIGVLGVVFSVIVVLAFIFILFEAWFLDRYTPVFVDGASMNNTLFDDDWVYADKRARAVRGDIVIVDVSGYTNEHGNPLFQHGNKRVNVIIKRLIATEGDAIYSDGDYVYVRYKGTEEFVALDEPYTADKTPKFSVWELGEGEAFFLGDNRGISHDSSEVGPLRYDDIMGVVPQWAVKYKGVITRWEQFGENFRNLFAA